MFDDPLVATLDKRVSFPPSKETIKGKFEPLN